MYIIYSLWKPGFWQTISKSLMESSWIPKLARENMKRPSSFGQLQPLWVSQSSHLTRFSPHILWPQTSAPSMASAGVAQKSTFSSPASYARSKSWHNCAISWTYKTRPSKMLKTGVYITCLSSSSDYKNLYTPACVDLFL